MEKKKKVWAFLVLSVAILSLTASAGNVYVSYVINDNTQVRAQPASSAQPIYSAPRFTVLEVVDHESHADWLQVITPGSDRGWILRKATTFYEDETVDPSIAKKGVVDREFSKKESLKMWQTTWKNSAPICDICSAQVPRDTGYILTTKQVLAARTYHDLLKRISPGIYKQRIAMFEQDRTPWCVCEACINTHFNDMPGSSSLTDLAAAQQANDDMRKRTIEAIKKNYTTDQVREKMRSGQLWFVEDLTQKNLIYPINPSIDGWVLEELENKQ